MMKKLTFTILCSLLLCFLGLPVFSQADSTDSKHTLPSTKGDGLDDYVKAEQLRVANKYPQAIPYYERALTKEPNNLEYLYNKCLCYYEGRSYSSADKCFKKVLDAKPDYIPAYDMMSNNYRQAKKYDEAVDALEKATEISDDPGEKFAFQFRIIDILFRRGKIEEAGKHIKAANDIFGGVPIPDLLYLQARYENTTENYEKALELLTTLDEMNGFEQGDIYDKNHYEMGYTLYKLGKYPEAEKAFSKISKGSQFAYRAKEFTPEFLMKVAEGYYKVYELELAKKLANQVVEMKIDATDAQQLKSKIEEHIVTDTLIRSLQFKLEMNEKARSGQLEGNQDPRKFLLSPPQQLEIYGKLTKLYLAVANYDDALEYSRMYSAMNPKNPLILFYQAIALHKVGDTGEAESLLLAISSTPQINRNARAMAAFALGVFQHETKQYALAIKNLKKSAVLSRAFSAASKYEIGRISVDDPESTMDEMEDDMSFEEEGE